MVFFSGGGRRENIIGGLRYFWQWVVLGKFIENVHFLKKILMRATYLLLR